MTQRYFSGLWVLLLTISLSIFAVGCDSDDGGGDGGGNNGGTPSNQTGQPLPDLGVTDYGGMMATISYSMNVGGFPVAMTMAYATFGDGGVDAGDVSVNSNMLGKMTQDGYTYYMIPDPQNPLQQLTGVNFDGSDHSWTVSGGSGVPSFSGSVSSPSAFNVTQPVANATVNKSAGLQIAWTNTSNDNNVMITLLDMDGDAQYFSPVNLADDGSHTISAGDMSDISGEAMLQVVKYRYNVVDQGGKSYPIIAEIVTSVTVTVQ
ncbi:MAG: hypothetical protein D6675_03895 [Gemmatimonadetes bacterium]|nr:MAG: hypothetical protein D6675_03895 [Gemmatimonadota bacterium]